MFGGSLGKRIASLWASIFFQVDASTDATMQLTHQYDQRMSKRRGLFFKQHLRLE
jgi:hypothetical protein